MKQNKIIFSIVIIAVALAFVIFSFSNKNRINEISSIEISEEELASFDIGYLATEQTDAPLISDLMSSDIIAVVEVNWENKIYNEYDILTEAKVHKTIKGNLDNEALIYIYEPCSINIYNDFKMLYITDGYMPMKSDEYYLVFLEFYEQPDGYEYSEKDLQTYKFYDKVYSKYALIPKIPDNTIANDKELSNMIFLDISEYDFYPSKKNDLENYRKLATSVMNDIISQI